MSPFHTTVVIAILGALGGISVTHAAETLIKQEALPEGAKITSNYDAPDDQRRELGRQLSARLAEFDNYVIRVESSPVRVNAVRVEDRKDLNKVFAALMQRSGDSNAILHDGETHICEVICTHARLRRAVYPALHIAPGQHVKLMGGEYPKTWKWLSETNVPSNQLASFNERLGVTPTALINQRFTTPEGIAVRVNVIAATTEDDATRLLERMTALVGNANEVFRVDKCVIEIICSDPAHKSKVRKIIEGTRDTAVYRVEMRVVPLSDGDPMQLNPAFNHFLKWQRDNDEESREALESIRDSFSFSSQVRLFLPSRLHLKSQLEQKSSMHSRQRTEDYETLDFKPVRRLVEYPCVDLTLLLHVQDRFPDPSDGRMETLRRGESESLVQATRHWPSDDPRIRRLAERITAGQESPLNKAAAIHRWVHEKIRFAGDRLGTRYGTIAVLTQKSGHCWDQSDVYVTLARAMDIPTRQLAGWVVGMSGHVWAESYLPSVGWLPVDPTSPTLGTSLDYLPFWASDDGHMLILYAAMPRITEVGP